MARSVLSSPTVTRTVPALLLTLVAALAAPARAQDWLLDDALAAFSTEAKDGLRREIGKAPERALSALLDQEADHLEALHEDELEAFAKEALDRLKAAREDGHLFREVRAALARAGALSVDLAKRVWAEERARLSSLPDRATFALVDTVLRRVVVERLTHLRDRRFSLVRADVGAGGGVLPDANTLRDGDLSNWVHANRISTGSTPRFAWAERGGPPAPLGVGTDLPLPNVKFWSDEARLREVLFERAYAGSLGDLKVEAASVDGLASARAGRVTTTDEFGRELEGYGATFTARARLTGVRADVTSRELALATGDLGVRARLMATLVDLASNVEATGTGLVSENGAALRTNLRAGAGVSASGRLPISIDLKVLTIRVIPYASVHAGAVAEAHGTLEVAWTGTVRFDVGASLSAGVGAGAGVIVELELGPTLKAALNKVITAVVRAGRPIADALAGKTWDGPSADSGHLVLTLADLEAGWAMEAAAGVAPPARPTDPAAVAARFAPVLYQRVKSRHDLPRRVDFDGDWDTTNNWDHADEGDLAAWAYYDVKETETHWVVTYALYWPRRTSTAPLFLNALRRHENDVGGCIVVARKGAPRGREVECLLTTDGERLHAVGPPRGERWDRRDGWWNGELRFVDEADHPLVDLERTHPQVWLSAKHHDVVGFTGRDDGDPFSGEDGVVYVPTGTAEAPEGHRDAHCGYALRPMAELLAHAGDPKAFTTDDLVTLRGTRTALPRRLRGDDGVDDAAVPPWAWADARWGEWEQDGQERRARDPRRTILEGDLLVDPLRALGILFVLPGDVSRRFTRNAWRGLGPTGAGLAETVARSP